MKQGQLGFAPMILETLLNVDLLDFSQRLLSDIPPDHCQAAWRYLFFPSTIWAEQASI